MIKKIAVRVINACRALNIGTVAIYSEPDRLGRHVLMADQSYALEGEPSKTYLDAEQIVAVAKRSGADAVHPGYGFLSENAQFAQLCLDAGLAFIGPQPDVISRMGSKVESRRAMEAAGVQVVPGTTDPVKTVDAVKELGKKYGYPIAIKASAGGGGRGLKVVRSENEVENALAQAEREGQSYFGSGEVYVEKYLDEPRHIEVQILADAHGNVVNLGERDCSSQRRHQKLLEESPATNLSKALREELLEAAVRGARSLNYTSAGTFEGLVADGKYYFLEVNTRVQVEHPVTELVTGIDIVKEQILIASGEPLSFKQTDVDYRGHAIECRINAENPYKNFMPNPGTVSRYEEPRMPWVRVDSACYQGYQILPFYDSLLAKLVVWGRDRNEAIARTKAALSAFEIEGVATTIPFHLAILSNPEFVRGTLHTNYVESKMLKDFMANAPVNVVTKSPVAGGQGVFGQSSKQSVTSNGKENLPNSSAKTSTRNFEVKVNEKIVNVSVTELVEQKKTKRDLERPTAVLQTSSSAPGVQKLCAPMSGLVKQLKVAPDQKVKLGEVLLIFEAMKMETELVADFDGVVKEISVKVGDTVNGDQHILTITQ
jgi:acetyl-CoA/propionyl-CoA carboxylase biotin carboxyl carrier protein